MNWYLKVLKQYVDFSGRAQRMEFWMFALINLIIVIVLGVIDSFITGGLIYMIYVLAVFLPYLAVGVRRLHDTGRSGWWLLIGLVPFIGIIVLIVFWVQDSQPETNAWGPNPKATLAPA
ncbi:MAG TPA: DUF805 domain-containing protein [Burkholderiales bacterium]|nr:DUF805 domain-containing protein [Burkholderiales bacterium]